MLSSANYAAMKGLRIVEPYLLYYSLFNTSRALVLLVPEQEWQDGRLLEESTHEKVRNVTVDQLRYLSHDVAHEYQDLAQRALVTRELFSYRFPATGLKNEIEKLLPDYEDVVFVCRYVAETAQLYSECLEKAFSKLGRPMGEFSEANLSCLLARLYTGVDVSTDSIWPIASRWSSPKTCPYFRVVAASV